MTPITHFLASWAIAEAGNLEERDKKWVTWAGVLPDLDALGMIPDAMASRFYHVDLGLFAQYHRVLLHGIWGALLISALMVFSACRRKITFFWCIVVIHFHFLCDFLGSRGPGPEDVWPIPYLGPISDALTFSWPGQWPINGWPNVVFTLLLIIFVFFRAVTHGHSPVSLFSIRIHEQFVQAVQTRVAQTKKKWHV